MPSQDAVEVFPGHPQSGSRCGLSEARLFPACVLPVTCHSSLIGLFLRVRKSYFKKYSVVDLRSKLEQRTGSKKLMDWARALSFDDGTLGNFLICVHAFLDIADSHLRHDLHGAPGMVARDVFDAR